jgi:hypothetical protein
MLSSRYLIVVLTTLLHRTPALHRQAPTTSIGAQITSKTRSIDQGTSTLHRTKTRPPTRMKRHTQVTFQQNQGL